MRIIMTIVYHHRYCLSSVVCLGLLGLCARLIQAAPAPSEKAELAGNWLGILKAPGVELRTGFTFTQKPDGTWSGTMSSIDQGAMNIPLDEMACINGQIKCSLKSMGASFEGTLLTAGNQLSGKWRQGGAELPLILDRVDRLPQLRRPQLPPKPYPYAEEEVRVTNSSAGVILAGTLTLPQSPGPHSAVILLTGSGPQNRDEELFQHKPFLVLADYLTRRGIAVLRMDDRGVGQSTGDYTRTTTGDFADDALAGLAFLKSRSAINASCIGLVGHSEGGMIAPIAATRSCEVAFIILLAGPGLPFRDIVLGQIQQELQQQGVPDSVIRSICCWQGQLYDIVGKQTSNQQAEEEILEAFSNLDLQTKQDLHLTIDSVKKEIPNLLGPWWRYAMRYSPAATLARVCCPVLALNGAKDMQVRAKENLDCIAHALKRGGNSHVTAKSLPGLNHLFQTAPTGAEAEYVKIEETLAPLAMQTIADWILALPHAQ